MRCKGIEKCQRCLSFCTIRWANWLENRRVEQEREQLLNTIALVEAELAKPRYFGFLIERDRVGYLEALSKTKTTFKGLNPHDPLNGIVANGEINPDFTMMLEKNFFKENSENLDKDELYFVRYQAEKNKLIGWLQNQFKELAIDDEYLVKELGISQEELFQRLQANTLIFATKVENGEFGLVDSCLYVDGVKNQGYYETIPLKFCTSNEVKTFQNNFTFLEKKERQNKKICSEEQRKQQEQAEKDAKVVVWVIIIAFALGMLFLANQYH